MKKVKKVFGIISYFPDNDSEYHIETRRERSRRFRELLFKLEELWPDVDIMVIAQNWQDFELPEIKNRIRTFSYGKLGILGARHELRKRFLDSPYDYLIMLDDDARITTDNPKEFMNIIDQNPDGIGVLRKNNAPLNMCAVSRNVYSQVEMVDVDPEKGEGFEDDLFVALCFNKFPDKAYMFPKGLVIENSLHYTGPGACPSTWARERKYDWKHMTTNTKSKIFALSHRVQCTPAQPVENPTMDLIIAYVNSADNYWVRDFIKATKTHNPSKTRFRSWGTLRYLLRGIEIYMPFIRNVILVVARDSQVPAWLNRKTVRIVYHEDFIPKQYLPTFNSCTIESFFWNIPDLSDRVIYFNDDMLPVGPMSEDDFFTGNTPHIKFNKPETYFERDMFRNQSRNSLDMILKALNLPEYPEHKVMLPYHSSSAIYKDTFLKIKELFGDTIGKTVSLTRDIRNVNQYIYLYYAYYTDAYVDDTVDFKYFDIEDSRIQDILVEIISENYQLLCLNDSDRIKDFAVTRDKIVGSLERKFPNRCKYEV